MNLGQSGGVKIRSNRTVTIETMTFKTKRHALLTESREHIKEVTQDYM